jgi:HD-GYP domain-containing protein (c-di-GMP phosphodiesterase class II)
MSLYAKLVAVNDIFDALVANRPYRKTPFTIRSALDRLIADMDDGMLPGFPVRLLISYFRRKKENFKTLKFSRHPREPEPEGNLYGKVAKA